MVRRGFPPLPFIQRLTRVGGGTANEFESWYRSQNVSSVATPLSTTSPATPGLLGSGGASESSDEDAEQEAAAFETVAVNGNGKRTHAGAEFVEPTVKRVKSESEEAVDRLSLGDTVTVKGASLAEKAWQTG
jgi:hypothetical protein